MYCLIILFCYLFDRVGSSIYCFEGISTIYLAQAIIPLILLLITAFGVGMILSTMAVFFRDLEYLWSVGLMIIMYASAIFYKPEKLLKSGFGWILKCNPLYLLIHNFRQAVLVCR